jgi:RimJ/RimL family protein N-acetyltransferase
MVCVWHSAPDVQFSKSKLPVLIKPANTNEKGSVPKPKSVDRAWIKTNPTRSKGSNFRLAKPLNSVHRKALHTMLLNYKTAIVGKHCLLVPYRPEHVERYHNWMLDPALLEATGSEPLSLEEEYEMQQSWRDDSEKVTFIILSRQDCVMQEENQGEFSIEANLACMVGDVNLFLSDEDESDSDDDDDGASREDKPMHKETLQHRQAEIDIMIAETSARGNGFGKEAACLMMMYGAKSLNIRRYFAKINEDNKVSRSLFGSKLGFQQCAYAECFRQVELELKFPVVKDMVEHLSTLLNGDSMETLAISDQAEQQQIT